MKMAMVFSALLFNILFFSFPARASSPTPSPIINCNSITGGWSGNLSNGITDFGVTIFDTGGAPVPSDADVNYQDEEGGSDEASLQGNCTVSKNTISMTLYSSYQPINFTVTLVDATHATVSGQFTDVNGGVVQASGAITRY